MVPQVFKNSRAFMVLECPLPLSQQHAKCPYPEPDQTSLRLGITFFEYPFQCYPVIYTQMFKVLSFPQISPPKFRMQLSSPSYVPYDPTILWFFISALAEYLVSNIIM
jgi:hypothetical protein